MKLFLTIALTTLILCARSTSGAGGFPGNFVIESTDKDGNVYCDGLLCPKNTFSCDVRERNDPENPQQLIREHMCMSGDGKVLKVLVTEKPNTSGGISDHNSFSFSNQGASDLNANQVEQALQGAFKALGGLFE